MAEANDSRAPASRNARELTSARWAEAKRVAMATLRKTYPRLEADVASSLADDAVIDAVKASRREAWRGDAEFPSLTTTIALRKAANLVARETKAKAPPKAKPRRDLKKSEDAVLGPVFEDFFKHHRAMMRGRVWGASGPGAYLDASIGTLLPHLYDVHDVPSRFRFDLRLAAEDVPLVDQKMTALRQLTPEGWVESADTLDTLPRIPGRPPRDPYLAGDHGPALQAAMRSQRERNSALEFSNKRQAVDDAVVRYALELAGLSRTLLNKIRARARSAETKAEQADRRRALKAYAAAAKKSASKTGS